MDPIPDLIGQVNQDRIKGHLFHLASDPLPFRTERPNDDEGAFVKAGVRRIE